MNWLGLHKPQMVRLLDEIFRLFAQTTSKDKLNDKLKSISNFREGQFKMPSMEFLKQFRAIVCTLQTAGSITRC